MGKKHLERQLKILIIQPRPKTHKSHFGFAEGLAGILAKKHKVVSESVEFLINQNYLKINFEIIQQMLVPIVEETDKVGTELEQKYGIIYYTMTHGLHQLPNASAPGVNPGQPKFPEFHREYIGDYAQKIY